MTFKKKKKGQNGNYIINQGHLVEMAGDKDYKGENGKVGKYK